MITKLFTVVFSFYGFFPNLQAQNAGIGTTQPKRATLEQIGVVGNTTAIFGADANGIGLIASWPQIDFNAYYNEGHRYMGNGYSLAQYFTANVGEWGFEPNASGSKGALVTGTRKSLAIAANGRVSIGTNPGFGAQLSVGRDVDKDASAYFAAPRASAFNYGSSEYTVITGGADQSKLYLNQLADYSRIAIGVSGSRVGINSGAPVYPLEMQAPDFCIGLMRLGSLNHWIISVNQRYLKLFFRSTTANNAITQLGVFDYTTGQYSASSDRRMKKNIKPLQGMLAKIMLLEPYSYQMKYSNPGHDETFGLIAQDVIKIFPELVHVTKNTNTGYENIKDVHTLNYSGLAPLVIKALQEQEAQLVLLEERAARLEKQ
ncbi:MAG: tail fiber domain-containing protein [Bacteroidota bacterium]